MCVFVSVCVCGGGEVLCVCGGGAGNKKQNCFLGGGGGSGSAAKGGLTEK